MFPGYLNIPLEGMGVWVGPVHFLKQLSPHRGVGFDGVLCVVRWLFKHPAKREGGFLCGGMVFKTITPRGEGFGGGSMCCSNVIKTNPRGKGFRWGRHGFQNNNSPWRGGL